MRAVNNIDLQFLLQKKKKPSKTANKNAQVESYLANFIKQHEQLKMKKMKKLLKESNAILTKKLMKESNAAYTKLMQTGPTRAQQLLEIAKRPNKPPTRAQQLLEIAKRPYNKPRRSTRKSTPQTFLTYNIMGKPRNKRSMV